MDLIRSTHVKVFRHLEAPFSLNVFADWHTFPFSLMFWLAFPDLGVLTAEQYGMVRAFIMERVRPKNFIEVFWRHEALASGGSGTT